MKCQQCQDTQVVTNLKGNFQPCDECCPHDEGWWELPSFYNHHIPGLDNACCNKGCGKMRRDLITTETTNQPKQ